MRRRRCAMTTPRYVVGSAHEGAVEAWTGQAEEGLPQIDRGLEIYQTLTTPPTFWSFLLYLKAQALGRAGRAAEGSAVLDEAMAVEGESEAGNLMLPEFVILKADLLLAGSDHERAEAASWLEMALTVADELDLRMPRLRAATRLFRLRRDGGAAAAARATLEDAYGSFTEGWSAVPLVEARELLGSDA